MASLISFIGKIFGADVPAPPDATKLDGTSEAALGRALSALPAGERGWISFAEARTSFYTGCNRSLPDDNSGSAAAPALSIFTTTATGASP